MNKQELIERYKIKYAEEPKDWKHPSVNASRQDLFANFIRDLEQLDEPQKPVIQQFVADLVDWTNKMQCAPSDVIRDLHDNGDLANLPRDLELDKLSEYFEKAYCRYDFEKACFVGYEVEKIQKYIVKIGKLYLKEPLGDTSNSTILTTWDKKCAYPFSSFHMADKHADKFEGAVEEVAER